MPPLRKNTELSNWERAAVPSHALALSYVKDKIKTNYQEVHFQFWGYYFCLLLNNLSSFSKSALICSVVESQLAKCYRNVSKILVKTPSKYLKWNEALRDLLPGLLASKRTYLSISCFSTCFTWFRKLDKQQPSG